MSIQAGFKTLLVVLAIGAVDGYIYFQPAYAVAPAERSARELAKCIKAGQMAAYRVNQHMMGRVQDASDKKVEAECRKQVQASENRKNLPAYLSESK